MKKIIRLNDRGIRQKLIYYRKKVYRIKLNGQKNIISVKFSNKKYLPLWQKNIQGLLCAKEAGVNCPQLIEYNKKTLTLILSDVGYDLSCMPTINKKILSSVFIELNNFINYRKRKKYFNIPRYLLSIYSSEQTNLVKKILLIAEKIKNKKIVVEVGPGLEDPSISNFCIRNNQISLIDFDNYSENINIYYELGFFIGDYFKEKQKYFFETTILKKEMLSLLEKKYFNSNKERLLILIGLLCPYLTVIYDKRCFSNNFYKHVECIIESINEYL